MRDLVVVGGGPAGLAVAIAAAQRGLEVLVLERGALPADKACGEGILPAGARALEALGARAHLPADRVAPIRAIRWIDGEVQAEARLPGAGGLGVRRTGLSEALRARALEVGAEVREAATVRGHRRLAQEVQVDLEGRTERAKLLVAADGLASAVREREGLSRPSSAPRRFGLRRHFALAPWSEAVEVHFGEGVEAYVTPVGPRLVGVAFLCEEASRSGHAELLARFPALRERLGGAPFASRPAGMGPLARVASARVAHRLVLAGDAAGYLDAITGEGVSLALQGALALAEELPRALSRGATAPSLARWARGERVRFARYAAATSLVLGLARRPAMRAPLLRSLARSPRLFAGLLQLALS